MVVVVASNILLLILLFIITVYGATVDPPIGDGVNVLLSNDDEQVAYQMGTHVMLRTPDGRSGFVDLILTNGFLEVEMDLQSCQGMSYFCYNSTDKMGPLNDICSHQDSCAFQVEGIKQSVVHENWIEEENYVQIGRDYRYLFRKYYTSCKSKLIRMQHWQTVFCFTEGVGLHTSYSCAPKMDSQNKIHIDVGRIDPNCWIKIANAQIYHPPPPTTPMIPTTASTEPPTTEPTPQPTTETPAYELWYFWLSIAVIVLIIIVAGVIIYLIWKEKLCFAKKKKKPLRTPSYPSTLPPPPPPARHQPSPVEIVTSVPKEASSQKAEAAAKNETSKKLGNAIGESLSGQQPTPTPAVSSTPAAEKQSQKPKEKDTVADKISKPKDKKSETPRALKYTNPPPATSESGSNHQRPPQKPYPKYPADKKYMPSRHVEKPPKFDDTTKPPEKKNYAPPTVTSITESNRNTVTEQQSKTTDASNKVQTGDSKMNSVASIK